MNLVIITSVINTNKKPLSYKNIRSVFTTNTRFSQTLETILSIRKYIPNNYIVLLEASILDYEKIFILKNLVDLYLNYTYDKYIYEAVNSPFKSFGEASVILKFLKSDKFRGLKNINNIFKISGRYYLNNKFNYSNYNNNYNNFKQESTLFIGFDRLISFFYKIKYKYIQEYILILSKNLDRLKLKNFDFETFLFQTRQNYILIKNLGVSGFVAVNGQFVSE